METKVSFNHTFSMYSYRRCANCYIDSGTSLCTKIFNLRVTKDGSRYLLILGAKSGNDEISYQKEFHFL